MTVRELIEQLKWYDGDRIVIIQKDPEGNYFSPCDNSYAGFYLAETSWRGDVGLEALTADDIACVVLTPIN